MFDMAPVERRFPDLRRDRGRGSIPSGLRPPVLCLLVPRRWLQLCSGDRWSGVSAGESLPGYNWIACTDPVMHPDDAV